MRWLEHPLAIPKKSSSFVYAQFATMLMHINA
jgi:hypothetical protein